MGFRGLCGNRGVVQSHSCARVPEQLLAPASAARLARPVRRGADSKPDLAFLLGTNSLLYLDVE